MNRMRILFFALGSVLLGALPARAQTYQLTSGNFNSIFIPPVAPPVGANETISTPGNAQAAATLNSNFQGMGPASGSAGPISTSTEHGDRYPSNPANTIVLVRCTFGGAFASGVPLYFMGDEILPPLTREDGTKFPGATDEAQLAAARSYWRAQPILPGENIPGLGIQFPLEDVTVTAAPPAGSTDKTRVTLATKPPTLVVGATLLGQPVTRITGSGPWAVTLAGDANETIGTNSVRKVTPATPFYYSRHADKVFASQPGQVVVTWLKRDSLIIKTETFIVSASSQRAVRTIFWTEASFNGPKVQITDARITTVNPVYYSIVPKAVPEEVSIPGYTPLAPNLTTLSFDKFNGVGQLHAHNVEGRILIEYLGNVVLGDIHVSLGTDVVELKREPDVVEVVQHLGTQLTPRVPLQAGDELLQASPVLNTQQGAPNYYGTSVQLDGTLAYYAERETSAANNPDDGEPAASDAFNKVVFYWLEAPPDNFGIKWPKFQTRYWQRWSPNLADYAHYTVDATGSTTATGVSFSGGTLPTIVWQDDPAQAEAQIDLNTQRLFVTFPLNSDLRNRALLKFSSSGKVWYVNLYSQAEARQTVLSATATPTTITVSSTAGLTVGMTVTGPGLIGPATIVAILDSTHLVLSQNLATDTSELTYGTATVLSSTSSRTVVTHSVPPGDVFDGDEVRSQDGLFRGIILKRVDDTHFIITRNSLAPFDYISDGTRLFDDYYGNNILWRTNWSLTTNNLAPNSVTVPSTLGLAAGTIVTGPGITGTATIVTVTDGTHYVLSQSIPDATNNLTYLRVQTSVRSTTTPVVVSSTVGLEVGMVVTGPGIVGTATILSIIDGTHLVLSQFLPTGTGNLTFTVQSDGLAPIDTTATVGTRLPPPAGHEFAGYISGGSGYYPAGYLNPFTVGVAAANLGAIIPVNARPTDHLLTVRWFKKVPAPNANFQDLYVPGKIGRYTVSYPTGTTPQIVIAEGVGTGNLSAAEAGGSVYAQHLLGQPGFNPNEEHAVMLGGRAYALREDLNVHPTGANYTAARYTSEPFVLVTYTDATDHRPAIHTYKVVREVDLNSDRVKDPGDILFDYNATAGTLLVKPYPLPLLPLPFVGTGANRKSKDIEIYGADDPANTNALVAADGAYKGFTFNDRKGFTWIHRGPHDTGAPTLSMKLYYLSREGFYLPGATTETGTVPPIGTVLPFLRNATRSGQSLDITKINAKDDGTPGDIDEPLTVIYRPVWPDDAPELRVGETLTLPKFDLPQVRGQTSAQVLYQQSIAKDTTHSLTKTSVTLHDPTRQKTLALDPTGVALDKIPAAIKTTSYQGKTYFQRLPPSLQKRFYLDPTASAKGTLYFLGAFHHGPDEGFSGDDYLDLNLLTAAEATLLKELVPVGDGDESKWYAAIDALKTAVETFVPDPAQAGSYKVGSSVAVYATRAGGRNPLAVITGPDTAVDSYAVTATGQGTGFVTMVFGNGKAFTPEGDPVQVKVFKIGSQLYTGDLKVLLSSNPLDEQVTLRHSGDFAGKPEDYEFEWRWTFGAASEPATYTSTMVKKIGNPAATPAPTDRWLIVSDPGALRPTDAQYITAAPAATLGSRNVHPVTGIFNAQGQLVTLPATQVSVVSTSSLTVGMTVIGPGITGAATIISIIDSTRYVLSQVIPDATSTLTYGGSLALVSTSTPLLSNLIEAASYTDAEIAAGYPALVAKSSTGVDFNATAYPLGVPETIVFSARLGSLDGCVLYVNGRVAVAYNAPTPQFTLTNARTGLTPLGTDNSLKQFSIAPGYFNAGPNIIEVALYTTADANAFSDLDFILEAAGETDNVASGSTWQAPGGQNGGTGLLPYGSSVIVGGDPSGPFGGPTFVLNDRWFTTRYRPKVSAGNVLGTPWSRWAPPQFVEGWIKRVLAAINPFEQRVKDLYNNAINTDVSVVTQAGGRWEGDIALTLENINDAGLIAIYETVLNRGKDMSINANTNDADSNNALLLAAGYLNDLYTILGNEAYADAANPTISIDDPSSVFEVNTSRFSFEGQVASSLDEELALLRGRDDTVSPGVKTSPVYNRLIWNYTRGINSGEVIYAVNYNIKEKAGSSTANGVIDESDALRMFPQGHGDAYGHYLTALTGYYRLLTNNNFDWQPRGEAVTVNGQAVTVDFADERKFAAAASNVARTAQQIVALIYRKRYKDDPANGWSHYRDGTVNSNVSPATTRYDGLDEWVSRSTQGAFYHWVVGNALVPDVDDVHTGVQKIDRTTVPELAQLSAAAATFQTTIDNANAHLNPLGLSPGAVALDIDPYFATSLGQELAGNGFQGASQHEQIYDRALRSLNNAAGAFRQAATMTRSLRDQQNQIDDYNTSIVQQETAYVNQLIDIFGRPYSGDIGPGKLYAQAYTGPDLNHWFIVDRPASLVSAVDSSRTFTIALTEARDISTFTANKLQDIIANNTTPPAGIDVSYKVQPSQWVQYSDVWPTSGSLGTRAESGELQAALQDAQQTWLALSELNVRWSRETAQLDHLSRVFKDLLKTQRESNTELATRQTAILDLEKLVRDREITTMAFELAGDIAWNTGDALGDTLPAGLLDIFSALKGVPKGFGLLGFGIAKGIALSTAASARYQQTNILEQEQGLEKRMQELGFSSEAVQLAYEYDNLYRESVTGANDIMQLALAHQSALQNVTNVLARGNRVLIEREVFRQRAAAIIQGYRTKDLSFRIFRNEALEQYRSLFDLASRYTYLTAKAYDYETALLGTAQGHTVFERIVAARSLGDLTDGRPQSTTSTLGDGGLAGMMAQINADFSVAEGRLGINNPDYYGTVFSLRAELFRLLDVPGDTSGDDAWRQTLERHMVANVLNDADVATQCRNIQKPDGSPVPGIIIEFSSTIEHGKNFFGLPLAAYDHAYSASSYGTKISNAGIVFPGYVGMDASITGLTDPEGNPDPTAGNPAHGLSGSPYVYLIPCGLDYMRAPLSGNTEIIRSWDVQDQALPLPYNLGANDFNTTQFFNANGTFSEQPWVIRRHQAFRAVGRDDLFYGAPPLEFSTTRLIARSAWNSRWKIIIPAYTLLNNEQEGLKRFAASVQDIKLYLRTYSHSGN